MSAKQTLLEIMVVALVATAVFFTNLGQARLWDRDEPRNAGCAWEMLQRGDLIVPTFNGQLRNHKPVLLYWFIMASYLVFGLGEFAARFPSALAAVGTVVLTYGIGRRLFGRKAALWAALALPGMLFFNLAAHAATPDSILIFWCTAALFLYCWGCFKDGLLERLFPQPILLVVLLYACLGMAVLAKGPVGLVLPGFIMFGFILWNQTKPHKTSAEKGQQAAICCDRLTATGAPRTQTAAGAKHRSTHWKEQMGTVLRLLAPSRIVATVRTMRPLLAIAVVTAVAAPWYIAVGIRTDGQFLAEFFLKHNLGRALAPMEGHAGPTLLFYPVALLVGTFPWSVFALPLGIVVARLARQNARLRPAIGFCLWWIASYLLVFSLARTKLPSYITPCYPAVALLLGLFVQSWMESPELLPQRWISAAFLTAIVIGFLLAVGLTVVALRFIPQLLWTAVVGVALAVTAACCLWLWWDKKRQSVATVFTTTAAGVCLFAFALIAPAASNQRHFLSALTRIAQQETDARVISVGVCEPSWVFYTRRQIKELLPAAWELLLAEQKQAKKLLVIMPEKIYQQHRDVLEPSFVAVTKSRPLFQDENLLLLLSKSFNSPPEEYSPGVSTADGHPSMATANHTCNSPQIPQDIKLRVSQGKTAKQR